MTRLMCVLLLLFAPLLACGQSIYIGDSIPQKAIEEAKQTLAAAQAKILRMNVGEFEVIEPAKNMQNVPMLQLPSNSPLFSMRVIPAKQSHSVTGTRRGDTGLNEYYFPAKDYAWSIITGKKDGESAVDFVVNGATKEQPPSRVDTLSVIIGKPAPKPVDPPDDPVIPVDDDLTKGMRAAFAKDKVAGIGDTKWLLPMAGIFEAASKDGLDTVKTAGDLDNLLYAARVAAGIPDPDKTLSETRQFIKRQLQANLTGGVDAPATVMDAAKKTLAKSLMAKVAESLEKLTK